MIQYQEKISTLVGKLNHTPEAGKISQTVLPVIKESSQHVGERIKEEAETLQNITELSQDKLDNKAKSFPYSPQKGVKEAKRYTYMQVVRHEDGVSIF